MTKFDKVRDFSAIMLHNAQLESAIFVRFNGNRIAVYLLTISNASAIM